MGTTANVGMTAYLEEVGKLETTSLASLTWKPNFFDVREVAF